MTRPTRKRPKLATTLDPEVDAALRAKADETGLPIGRVADTAIRAGLGMPSKGPRPLTQSDLDYINSRLDTNEAKGGK